MRVITADEAAGIIQDGWTVIPGGFGCCGHPEAITAAIGRRFLATGRPANINLLFAAGSGDKKGRGLDHLAREGLVNRAIGGFWGFSPDLANLALGGVIEGHNWPQGVISQIFRASAAKLPWIISRVGLGTFVDPRNEGGRMSPGVLRSLVDRVEFDGQAYLQFPTTPVHCAIIRGTRCDELGNLTMENEISLQDGLAQAQAARNHGGIVIAQVCEIVRSGTLRPQDVRVPGSLITHVVVAEIDDHPQSYGEDFNAAYVSAGIASAGSVDLDDARHVITSRAVEELGKLKNPLVNLGIGIPADIGTVAHAQSVTDYTLTVESGQFGGIPARGLSFGASAHPAATIEQSALFDFYDGGGIDLAFLGFAQVDNGGNVNASHFGGRSPGIGGFANISRAAKRVIFCGTFNAKGLEVALVDAGLAIKREGAIQKFVPRVDRISFSGEQSALLGQHATIVTERAVFEISGRYLKLVEIAPGIEIEKDIFGQIAASVVVSNKLKSMSKDHFVRRISI